MPEAAINWQQMAVVADCTRCFNDVLWRVNCSNVYISVHSCMLPPSCRISIQL